MTITSKNILSCLSEPQTPDQVMKTLTGWPRSDEGITQATGRHWHRLHKLLTSLSGHGLLKPAVVKVSEGVYETGVVRV